MRGGAGEFVSIVVTRERAISKALMAGDDRCWNGVRKARRAASPSVMGR